MGVLYTKMKIFHFRDKLDSLSEENSNILPPLHIRLKPTNVCNHNCWYCAYRLDGLQLGKDMVNKDQIPREKMFEIIDDLSQMQIKAVTFSGGGEPFCYPYFKEALKRISATPIKIASLTNGSKLEGEIAEIFAQRGTWIRISLDGWDDESYAKYRRVKIGEFSKILKNIKDFVKLKGGCYVGVCINVDKKNARHLFALTQQLKELGVNSVKLAPCFISNDSSENNKYHHQIRGLLSKEAEKIKGLVDESFEFFNSYPKQLESFAKHYSWCPNLQIVPVIGADLNVYSCQDKAYNFDNGLLFSIKERSFKEAWFSDKSNFFKINPQADCQHHCINHDRNSYIFDYLNADKNHLAFV